MRSIRSAAGFAALLAVSMRVCAVDTGIKDDGLLQPYEPITAGCTKDSNDVPFLDVTLSLKLRLLPPELLEENQLFLAFMSQQRPQFANDYISRGWDYLEVIWKRSYGPSPAYPLSSYVDVKYFLNPGLLQGRPEQYQSFENDPQGKPRRDLDGLSGLLEYQFTCTCNTALLKAFSDPSLWLKCQTGYTRPHTRLKRYVSEACLEWK